MVRSSSGSPLAPPAAAFNEQSHPMTRSSSPAATPASVADPLDPPGTAREPGPARRGVLAPLRSPAFGTLFAGYAVSATIPFVTTRDRASRHRAVGDAATAQVGVTADQTQSGRRT